MKDKFEQSFLRYLDKSGWWGPFLHLRPPAHTRIRATFIANLAVLAGPVASLLLTVFESVLLWRQALLSAKGLRYPPSHAKFLVIMGFALFVLLCLHIALAFSMWWLQSKCAIWAWNRRADRLAQLPSEETLTVIEGVWPPPPRVPGQ